MREPMLSILSGTVIILLFILFASSLITCMELSEEAGRNSLGICKRITDQSACETVCRQQKLTDARIQKHVGCVCWQKSKVLKLESCAHQ